MWQPISNKEAMKDMSKGNMESELVHAPKVMFGNYHGRIRKSGKSKGKFLTLMVATISGAPLSVSGFSSSALSPGPLRQPLHFQIPSPSRLPMALTDPETLLRETTNFKTKVIQRKLKKNSSGIEKQIFYKIGTEVLPLKDNPSQDELRNQIEKDRPSFESRRPISSKRPQPLHTSKRSKTTTPTKETTIKTETKTVSKSSTMPGFIEKNHSGRHRKFREGLKIAQNANKAVVANRIKKAATSKKEASKRRKDNSMAMYSTSSSVPDSLIAFTNEIHLVRKNKELT